MPHKYKNALIIGIVFVSLMSVTMIVFARM